MTFNLKANMKPTKMKTKIKLFESGDRRKEYNNFSLSLKKTDIRGGTTKLVQKGSTAMVHDSRPVSTESIQPIIIKKSNSATIFVPSKKKNRITFQDQTLTVESSSENGSDKKQKKSKVAEL